MSFSGLKQVSMDKQDEYLRQIIAALRQHSKGSREWRTAMNQLLSYVQRLLELAKCSHPDYPEVLSETLDLVSTQIQEFQPRYDSLSSSLAGWIYKKLRHKYRTLELYRANPCATLSLDYPIGYEEDPGGTTLTELIPDPQPSTIWEIEAQVEQWQQQEKNVSVGNKIWRYIEQDPEKRLRSCHPRQNPECNCQLLSQRILLKNPPDKLPDLAKKFNIPYQTLVSHWKSKGLPLLQTIARELGY